MGVKTKISYCDSSVNPIMGCTGCALRKNHCYAAALCTRYAGHKDWPQSFDQPEFFPGRLEKAVNWSDLTGKDRPDKPWLNGLPRRIFVNDLSDGFCPDIDPWHWLAPYIPLMHLSSHIWLLLTKWPGRMRKFFGEWNGPIPSNFHLGVSVENQAAADERREYLRQCPAAVKFVSYEPAIGPVDWTGWEFVDQIISGGESGSGARPSHPDWHRATRDFCQANDIAYFFKQWGVWGRRKEAGITLNDGPFGFWDNGTPGYNEWVVGGFSSHGEHMVRVGKKRAGHLLDGRTWQQFPAADSAER